MGIVERLPVFRLLGTFLVFVVEFDIAGIEGFFVFDVLEGVVEVIPVVG